MGALRSNAQLTTTTIHSASKPAAKAPLRLVKPARRYPEIDITRGIFLTLMTSTHAMGLAGVAADSFLRSPFWLPRGWATVGFPMLTGFTVALVFDHTDHQRLRSLRARAGRLLAVVVVTNLCFVICKELLSGRTADLRTMSWWIRVATLQIDPTISAVLVPTALVLLLLPWLIALGRRWSAATITTVVLAAFVGAWAVPYFKPALAGSALMSALFIKGLAGFPIVPLACAAPVGLILGVAWSRLTGRGRPPARREALAVFLSAIAVLCWLPGNPFLQSTVGTVLRFLTITSLAVMLAMTAPLPRAFRFFAVLGRYSLMVFIAHRLIQQMMMVAASRLTHSPAIIYAVLAGASLTTVGTLCLLRHRHASLDRALTKIFL